MKFFSPTFLRTLITGHLITELTVSQLNFLENHDEIIEAVERLLQIPLTEVGHTGPGHQLEAQSYPASKPVQINVADPDPGSGASLTLDPVSRISSFRIPDHGSQTHIFDSNDKFWDKTYCNFFTLSKLNYLQVCDICDSKKWVNKKKLPLLFWCCCWIRDPGSEIRDG
jgi:hypothetical protein